MNHPALSLSLTHFLTHIYHTHTYNIFNKTTTLEESEIQRNGFFFRFGKFVTHTHKYLRERERMSRRIDMSEIRSHSTSRSLWIVIGEKVWDLTSFANAHPGTYYVHLSHIPSHSISFYISHI